MSSRNQLSRPPKPQGLYLQEAKDQPQPGDEIRYSTSSNNHFYVTVKNPNINTRFSYGSVIKQSNPGRKSSPEQLYTLDNHQDLASKDLNKKIYTQQPIQSKLKKISDTQYPNIAPNDIAESYNPSLCCTGKKNECRIM